MTHKATEEIIADQAQRIRDGSLVLSGAHDMPSEGDFGESVRNFILNLKKGNMAGFVTVPTGDEKIEAQYYCPAAELCHVNVYEKFDIYGWEYKKGFFDRYSHLKGEKIASNITHPLCTSTNNLSADDVDMRELTKDIISPPIFSIMESMKKPHRWTVNRKKFDLYDCRDTGTGFGFHMKVSANTQYLTFSSVYDFTDEEVNLIGVAARARLITEPEELQKKKNRQTLIDLYEGG